MSIEQYKVYANTKLLTGDQQLINGAIIRINKLIVKFNKINHSQTTWVAGLVHSYFKGSYHHYYKRLSDGCHPDHATKVAWAAQILRSVRRLSMTLH